MSAREELARLMDATVANAAKWHYVEERPFPTGVTLEQAIHGNVTADCSAGVKILSRLAGVPSPDGDVYGAGYGNTVSIFQHLPHAPTLAALDVGDLVIYGRGGSEHVSMVRERGADPLLWSNGWSGAPEFVRFSTQRQHHSSTVTFCTISAPPSTPPQPPVDPYWVWLRWNLGEGEFKGHKREPSLRPASAPRRVPDSWWRRRERFLAARKKPGIGSSRPTARTA